MRALLMILVVTVLMGVPAGHAKKKKKPEFHKMFKVVNQDMTAYMIYFGCMGMNSLKQELGPGETQEYGGNDQTCQIVIRPSDRLTQKILQKSCDLAAEVTITSGKAEVSGCQES